MKRTKGYLYNRLNGKALKVKMQESEERRLTLSFYKYFHIVDPDVARNMLYKSFDKLQVKGRIYLATEGINGQISLPPSSLDAFKSTLEDFDSELQGVRLNLAIEDDGKSFFKLIIKVRKKIVADGLEDISYVFDGGTHIDAERFNDMSGSDSTVVVDMRNHYESEVGHFENAICPDVETFREALPAVAEILEDQRNKEIIMYCTGGIRCEKASAYLKKNGFDKVYQLDGGIIEYARQVEAKGLKNKFRGKNFVFDERLGERISMDVISRCHQCGQPSDQHANCANDACHLLFIQCESCADKYSRCCSVKCQDFQGLSKEEQILKRKFEKFNGSRFSKGRYKLHSKRGALDLS